MTDRPTPEFFDPANPHIGFTGSEFGPPTSGLDFSKLTAVKKAGQTLGAGIQRPATGIIETLTGVIDGSLEDLEEWILSIPILGDIWAVVKKVITGDGDIEIPDILGDARDFLANLDRILQQIVDILRGLVVTPINEAVQGVKDWFADLLGFRSTTTTNVTTALTAAEQAQTEVSNIGQSVVTVADQVNATIGVPYWISPNPFEDVSFPVCYLIPDRVPATPTGVANGGDGDGSIPSSGNHSHAVTVTTQQPMMTMVNQRLYLIPIRALQNRPYSTQGFVTDGTAGMGFMFQGVYRVDASTGLATKVYDAGNIKGSLITGSTPVHQRLQAPSDIIAQAQENMYLGLLATGGGTMAKLAATLAMKVIPPAGVFPPVLTGYVDGLSSLPSTISNASIQTDLGFQVWGCLGQPTEAYDPGAQFAYSDSFNRSDGAGYGASWITVGANQGVVGGMAGIVSGLHSDGARGALFINPLNTDQQEARMILGDNPNSRGTSLYVRSRNDFSSYAVAQIKSTGKYIGSGTSLSSATVRRSDTSTPVLTAGAEVVFTVDDDDVYTLTYPGGEISWDDSTGIVPKGSQCRYVGFGLERAAFTNSARVNSWSGKDFL
ncbi:hypothetical protein P3H15_27160 [Rhodococcus sp. T2V]|uniref:hypothetical protein n=1 Tax=Rhodococcus sp. T2V TaxID=3034164 RepID=UPI0023E299F5|nr:hypothetical protein [Rhodococcus sp. T2V]MDF3308701.1 hypothetical protein [Rhodococcus sp. T2V]